jgi:hypothetical protein
MSSLASSPLKWFNNIITSVLNSAEAKLPNQNFFQIHDMRNSYKHAVWQSPDQLNPLDIPRISREYPVSKL